MKYRFNKQQMMDFIDRAENQEMLEIAEEYLDLHVGKTFAKTHYVELLDLIQRQKETFLLIENEYYETKMYGALIKDLI